MSTSHIIDRRHAAPVLPASDLRPGERFLDQTTGRLVTFTGALPEHIDPNDLVNLEARA